jgi:hypothetical protein
MEGPSTSAESDDSVFDIEEQQLIAAMLSKMDWVDEASGSNAAATFRSMPIPMTDMSKTPVPAAPVPFVPITQDPDFGITVVPQEEETDEPRIPASVKGKAPVRPKADPPDDQDPAPIPSLQAIEDRIRAAETRKVDTAGAATLFNDLRRYGPRFRGDDRATSNDDLMNAITDQQVNDWYRVQGITPEEVNAMRKYALISGAWNPTGSILFNIANYIFSPLATTMTGDSWIGAGLGIGFSFLSAPANSYQQAGIVTLCENIRERGGHTVAINKKAINDKHWPAELADKLTAKATDFTDSDDALAGQVRALITKYAPPSEPVVPEEDDDPTLGVPGAWREPPPPPAPITQEQMDQMLASASDEEIDELEGLCADYRVAEKDMEALQRELFMTQASYKQQEVGNNWQIIPRTLRSPVSSLVGLGRGRSADQIAGALDAAGLLIISRIATLSSRLGLSIQAILAISLNFAHAGAAALDERNKQEYRNKMNLMYGDFLEESGQEKLDAGQPITAADINEKKLRAQILSKEQAMVKRLTAIVTAKIKEKKAEIAEIQRKSQENPQSGANEAGTDVRPADAIKIEDLETFVAKLEAEEKLLKKSELSKLGDDSFSKGLIDGNLDGFWSSFLKEDLLAKYKKPGEIPAQTAQRVGQIFHMGIFGSGASSFVGKLGNAAVGGSSHASTAQVLGLAATGATLGFVGATSQSAAINIKNYRRENEGTEDGIGFWNQSGRGMAAAPLIGNVVIPAVGKANRSSKRAHADVGETLTNLQVTRAFAAQIEARQQGKAPVVASASS